SHRLFDLLEALFDIARYDAAITDIADTEFLEDVDARAIWIDWPQHHRHGADRIWPKPRTRAEGCPGIRRDTQDRGVDAFKAGILLEPHECWDPAETRQLEGIDWKDG